MISYMIQFRKSVLCSFLEWSTFTKRHKALAIAKHTVLPKIHAQNPYSVLHKKCSHERSTARHFSTGPHLHKCHSTHVMQGNICGFKDNG